MGKYILHAKAALIGDDLDVYNNVYIQIEDELIVDIRIGEEINKNDCHFIDISDWVLMPGLIDCHNHVSLDARLNGHLDMMSSDKKSLEKLALKNMKDDLMSGVTSSRCMGDRFYIDVEFKERIHAGEVIGPNLFVCGIGMRSIRGHGYVALGFNGRDEFESCAKENIQRGVDLLKIFATPGTPPLDMKNIKANLSLDEIGAVTELGKKNNLPVSAHCIGGKALYDCVNLGVTYIEHAYCLNEEEAQYLKEQGITVVLTSGIILDESREEFCPPEFVRIIRDLRKKVKESLSLVMKYKIPFILGTDAYHTNLYKELLYACELGASKQDALKGVTVNAAKSCRNINAGSIKIGMNADLIACKNNPYDNLSNLSDIKFVMKNGEVFK